MIPRYSISPVWGWLSFIRDDKSGKFCEFRDYARLQAKMKMLEAELNYSNHQIARLRAIGSRMRNALPDQHLTLIWDHETQFKSERNERDWR